MTIWWCHVCSKFVTWKHQTSNLGQTVSLTTMVKILQSWQVTVWLGCTVNQNHSLSLSSSEIGHIRTVAMDTGWTHILYFDCAIVTKGDCHGDLSLPLPSLSLVSLSLSFPLMLSLTCNVKPYNPKNDELGFEVRKAELPALQCKACT